MNRREEETLRYANGHGNSGTVQASYSGNQDVTIWDADTQSTVHIDGDNFDALIDCLLEIKATRDKGAKQETP